MELCYIMLEEFHYATFVEFCYNTQIPLHYHNSIMVKKSNTFYYLNNVTLQEFHNITRMPLYYHSSNSLPELHDITQKFMVLEFIKLLEFYYVNRIPCIIEFLNLNFVKLYYWNSIMLPEFCYSTKIPLQNLLHYEYLLCNQNSVKCYWNSFMKFHYSMLQNYISLIEFCYIMEFLYISGIFKLCYWNSIPGSISAK